MKTYKFSFTGRQTGAIGITYKIAQEYKAIDIAEAVSMLFTDYEHFRGLKLNGKDFEVKSEYLDKAPNYKGLGIKRK